MRKFNYHGQIITASSKQEAIKVIAGSKITDDSILNDIKKMSSKDIEYIMKSKGKGVFKKHYNYMESIFKKAKKGDKSILSLPKELLMIIKDEYGRTPVHLLASGGVKEVIKLPKKLLMVKDEDEETPIHWLARRGVKEVLKLPKEMLTIKNVLGETPVHWIAEQGIKEVLKLPKELLMIRNESGNTPVHELTYNGVKEILKLPKELLMIRNGRGETPKDILHYKTSQ